MTDKHISEQAEDKSIVVPVSEKFMLSIKEASAYFSIGTKRCGGWQRTISGNSRYAAGTGTLS